MAIIRNPVELNSVNYFATLALLGCMSCLVLMLKFGGFKATLNLIARRQKDEDEEPSLSMTGAYRINRDEFNDSPRASVPPKKLSPSTVPQTPSIHANPQLRPARSTSDLVRPNNLPPNLNKSTNDVSYDPRGGTAATSNRNTTIVDERKLNVNSKEQKKLEKKRQAEEKARAKAAAQEQAKQEKLRKEREKQAARERAKAMNASKKNKAPVPKPPAAANPQPSRTVNTPSRSPNVQQPNPPPLPVNQPYSSNTLQSSISRSSGPPPYAEVPTARENGNRNAGNVIFSKPIEEPPNSWDLISQHRQQMSRPTTQAPVKGTKKNMVMDLQYKLGNDGIIACGPSRDNSEV